MNASSPSPSPAPAPAPASAPGQDAGPLIAFRGTVQVQAGCGAVTLLLRGREALGPDSRRSEFSELAFAAAQVPALPLELLDARVFGPGDPAGNRRRYRIEAARGASGPAGAVWSTEVLARSVQVHREAAQALIAAVAPPRVPVARRLGWLALLSLLRLPGAKRLLQRIRGAT